MPHFEVTGLDHARVAYSRIWQRKNLVLLTLSGLERDGADDYVARLRSALQQSAADDVVLVTTQDAIDRMPPAGVVVADRWGEIAFIESANRIEDLPPVGEVVEWLAHVRTRCPECEGEVK